MKVKTRIVTQPKPSKNNTNPSILVSIILLNDNITNTIQIINNAIKIIPKAR